MQPGSTSLRTNIRLIANSRVVYHVPVFSNRQLTVAWDQRVYDGSVTPRHRRNMK